MDLGNKDGQDDGPLAAQSAGIVLQASAPSNGRLTGQDSYNANPGLRPLRQGRALGRLTGHSARDSVGMVPPLQAAQAVLSSKDSHGQAA